ncbi:Pre-mRNA splicing factor PRP21 like protein-domain-containing protein [Dimargaris cristalligena]|uniref:Pre-mRNA splicing factor PRP21 like protein-domain-containing protein n=1 Tax=Dimargaris cristalligena TaxID=215637 RepID=A0A4P9ZU82_9FUNG|nr:Pre-mRNA splicing factor PRP21 like protein-domain-containing protein [Dimargaris cristalligena]|eukprot:RKP36342.1 Pre-mRNA splicing factor PRP21 like protein-domain-containing protein [Dimargaris cristalligena]
MSNNPSNSTTMETSPDPLLAATDVTSGETSATSKPLIQGIIYPPLDIRNIVDKTAKFVAKSGDRFEEHLRETNRNTPKFSFLTATDPYHAYYQLKVREAQGQADGASEGAQAEGFQADVATLNRELDQGEADEAVVQVAPPKPPNFEFVYDLPSITAQDLDVLQLTAQYVAVHGRQFMTSLVQREQKNYQFAFLRPSHSLFSYFTKLVDQYTKILQPSPELLANVEQDAQNQYHALDRVRQRVEYETFVQEEKRKVAEKEKQERQAFAAIDWHDFIVIGTMDLRPDDNFKEHPLPLKLADLQGMSMAQKKMAQDAAEMAAPGVRDMDTDEGSDTEAGLPDEPFVYPAPDPVLAAPIKPMKIKTNYVPKARTAPTVTEATQICPRCHQAIPVSEMDEHVRIELLDPKWKEQKEAALAKQKESNLVTTGQDVQQLLKNLSGHRSDNSLLESTSTSKPTSAATATGAPTPAPIATTHTNHPNSYTTGAPRKPEPVIWDGHSASINLATQRAQANLTIEEQIAAIHRAKGITVDPKLEQIGPQIGQGQLPAKHQNPNSISGSGSDKKPRLQ